MKMEVDQQQQEQQQEHLISLPDEILLKILGFCHLSALDAVSSVDPKLSALAHEVKMATHVEGMTRIDDLPPEIILYILGYLDRPSLGRVARVSKAFNDLVKADTLWAKEASECLVTNGQDEVMIARTAKILGAKDRVRISRNWTRKFYCETKLLVQSERFMPRLQLESDTLWVSWGNKIWAHPRMGLGRIGRKTTKVLKGHTDDVSRFVVNRDAGIIVSGGRDATLVGWDAFNGEFLFAKRYCHGGEVSAVDATRSYVVTGSRDFTVKLWELTNSSSSASSDEEGNYNNNSYGFPKLAQTINIDDRIWSLSASPTTDRVVIGSAGLCGIPPLHVLDPESGTFYPMGAELRRGAGMLDLAWHTPQTFLSCGYDACARLWDLRCNPGAQCVRVWEEPFDEVVYCLSTDNNYSLVCGTARHGLTRLWDMRQPRGSVQFYYAKHARVGQSSPVYSVAFDQANLYVALDQCLNLISFSGYERDFVDNK